jgi:hypothetical protein
MLRVPDPQGIAIPPSNDRPASGSVDPIDESAGERNRPVDEIAVVDRDLSIVEHEAGDELQALSERLRRVEEELDGVFETIGRLLRGGENAAAELQRIASRAVRLDRVETTVVGALAEERDEISRALDEHFSRLERVLTGSDEERRAADVHGTPDEGTATPQPALPPADRSRAAD